jgi:hypothetical protein
MALLVRPEIITHSSPFVRMMSLCAMEWSEITNLMVAD